MPPKKELPRRGRKSGDALFSGYVLAAARAGRVSRHAGDVWALIYAAIAIAHKKGRPTRLGSNASQLLIQVLSDSRDATFASAELQKVTLNLSGLPSMRSLGDFASQLNVKEGQRAFRFSLASLSSSLAGPEDISDGKRPDSFLTRDEMKGESLDFWLGHSQNSKLDAEVAAFGRAVQLERDNEFASAVTLLQQSVSASRSPPLSVSLLMHCLSELGAHQSTIALVANEVTRSEASLERLPFREALSKVPFDAFKTMGNQLAPLIALDLAQRFVDSDKTRSQLRFMTKRFLSSTKGKRTSLLWDTDGPFDRDQFVYFLRNVCVPSVIDMSGIFASSNEVLEERQAICGVLNTLDPRRSEDYRSEILGIAHQMTISEGLSIVNKNRIHVDTDMLARAFERTSAEEYARYLDLQDARIGAVGDFDDVVRDLLNSQRQGKQVLFTPQNEADTTFVILVARVLTEFLHHPTYGLDYFLSK